MKESSFVGALGLALRGAVVLALIALVVWLAGWMVVNAPLWANLLVGAALVVLFIAGILYLFDRLTGWLGFGTRDE